MRITDLLDARSISLQAAPGNKEEALNQAVELMTQRGNISDKAAYRRQVGEREKESTTGIGEGIAIPHGKCAAVSAPGLAAMVFVRRRTGYTAVFDSSTRYRRQYPSGCTR